MRMALYRFKERFKHLLPVEVKKKILQFFGLHITRNRRATNDWLRENVADIPGSVLSIGSGSDSDKEGKHYRDYFTNCVSYTTSDITTERGAALQIDVRSMPQIAEASYDCVFCGNVLEHVDDFMSALSEITRILKPGGILVLGLPFRQPLHLEPHDYWRFTEYGIRYLLQDRYEILCIDPVEYSIPKAPASYWAKARKR